MARCEEKIMMKHKSSALILLAAMTFGGAYANAQQAGPGQGGGQGRGRGQGQGGRAGAMMTPQQMQQMREGALKTQMTALAIPETAQTAIIAYANARETAALPLRAQARTLQRGLNNNLSAEAATRQLTALRDAVRAEKERRAGAERELDAAVGFSKNPQLEAYLTLTGLIGEESAMFSAPGAGGGRRGGRGGMDGQGGRGGQGGGRGGRRGGGQGGANGGAMNGNAPA